MLLKIDQSHLLQPIPLRQYDEGNDNDYEPEASPPNFSLHSHQKKDDHDEQGHYN